jgi:hypothetical protein
MLKSLNADRFEKPVSDFSPGPAPVLNWIEIHKLVIDDRYQRGISRRGSQNIAQIAEHFDWSKFAPVIVAPVEDGLFAIVDGQHRTTAAMLRGLKSVPCQIVQADRAQQAAAYAAVNGNVTKTTHTQLFHARLAAGDERARAIASICTLAQVTVTKTNTTQSNMKAGQTSAVGAIMKCHDLYGGATLLTALRCITGTADGNAGYLRSTIIEALCIVLDRHPEWQKSEENLLKQMQKFSFPDAWEAIVGSRDQIFPNTAKSDLVERLEKHLSRRFAHVNKQAA